MKREHVILTPLKGVPLAAQLAVREELPSIMHRLALCFFRLRGTSGIISIASLKTQ